MIISSLFFLFLMHSHFSLFLHSFHLLPLFHYCLYSTFRSSSLSFLTSFSPLFCTSPFTVLHHFHIAPILHLVLRLSLLLSLWRSQGRWSRALTKGNIQYALWKRAGGQGDERAVGEPRRFRHVPSHGWGPGALNWFALGCGEELGLVSISVDVLRLRWKMNRRNYSRVL